MDIPICPYKIEIQATTGEESTTDQRPRTEGHGGIL